MPTVTDTMSIFIAKEERFSKSQFGPLITRYCVSTVCGCWFWCLLFVFFFPYWWNRTIEYTKLEETMGITKGTGPAQHSKFHSTVNSKIRKITSTAITLSGWCVSVKHRHYRFPTTPAETKFSTTKQLCQYWTEEMNDGIRIKDIIPATTFPISQRSDMLQQS